jgi:hypothetical protein
MGLTPLRLNHPFVALAITLGLSALALPATSFANTEFPKRKEGLWELKAVGLQATGMPATQFCVGDKTDQFDHALDRVAAIKGSCKFGSFKRAGEAWLAESICKEGKRVVTSRSIASGDFEAFYRIDTHVTYEPPLGGVKREDKDALEGRFLGPCLPGQKAGDSVVPGMGTLNMHDGTFKPEPEPRAPKKGRKPKARQ